MPGCMHACILACASPCVGARMYGGGKAAHAELSGEAQHGERSLHVLRHSQHEDGHHNAGHRGRKEAPHVSRLRRSQLAPASGLNALQRSSLACPPPPAADGLRERFG
eukprot:349751-Chlamydomonas_euryale.AAC.3